MTATKVIALLRVSSDAQAAPEREGLPPHAGDEGKLFGSISDADIATAITKFTGIDVDRKLVSLDAPIKEIGLHEVALRPHPEVEFIVTLDVIPA